MATPLRSEVLKPFALDSRTLLSLAVVFSLLPAAQLAARYILPFETSQKYTYLFVWLLYDFLTHIIIEGSFLYHCFSSYITISDLHPASLGRPEFLDRSDRRYGSLYSDAPFARLWMEYSKSDARWAGSDLGVISVELITVLGAGPLALYTAYLVLCLAKAGVREVQAVEKATLEAKLWLWVIVLSTAELYGCWMTFCPEWISGNKSIAGSDEVIYFYLYLVFFNMVWVVVPAWLIVLAYGETKRAWIRGVTVQDALKTK